MLPFSRRLFLAGMALSAATQATVVPTAGKLKVVVAGGHPGDPEYGCGGTVARYTQLGHEATLLYLNRGEKGCGNKSPDDCATIRVAEAGRACGILKAKPRFASEVDGEATVDSSHYDEFRQILAAEKPDVLFTQWPVDNHRDHRAISLLTYDAWLHLGKTFGLYYYEVSDGEDTTMFSPTEYVDVTSTQDLKRSACFAHASQSPDRFYDLQQQVMKFRGVEGGYAYAEAFRRHPQSPRAWLP